MNEAKDILSDATEFLEKLTPICAEKEKEYNVRKLLRTGEETAIAKAISIINNDAAYDTFEDIEKQKSFLQLSVTRGQVKTLERRRAAERLLRASSSKRLSRLASLLQAGNPFETVLTQIEKMLDLIKEEAKVDKERKDWCISEREENDEELGNKNDEITNLEDDIDKLDDLIDDPETGLKKQIKDTNSDIDENLGSQKDETAARRKENAAYQRMSQRSSKEKKRFRRPLTCFRSSTSHSKNITQTIATTIFSR